MRKRLRQLRWLFLALLLLAPEIHSQTDAHLSRSDGFTNKTDSLQLTLDITDLTKTTRVLVQTNVKTGRIEWTLRDPSGVARLTGEASAGKVKWDTGDLQPMVGTWTFEMKLKKASGSYNVQWTAH
jgi:hypothetical protein